MSKLFPLNSNAYKLKPRQSTSRGNRDVQLFCFMRDREEADMDTCDHPTRHPVLPNLHQSLGDVRTKQLWRQKPRPAGREPGLSMATSSRRNSISTKPYASSP